MAHAAGHVAELLRTELALLEEGDFLEHELEPVEVAGRALLALFVENPEQPLT